MVEACMTYKKPMSFTAKIDFMDEDGNLYSIPISGTTDNSVLTSFPFIQRNPDECRLETNEGEPITLKQEVGSDVESMSVGKTQGFGGTRTSGSSVMSRSARSLVGYNPIPIHLLEKGLDCITKWLNSGIHLGSSITKFPDDIIASNGSILFEIVQALSGKMPPGMVKTVVGLSKKDTVTAMVKQYEEIITYLKI
jgi:hypothetical protein